MATRFAGGFFLFVSYGNTLLNESRLGTGASEQVSVWGGERHILTHTPRGAARYKDGQYKIKWLFEKRPLPLFVTEQCSFG